MSRPPHTTLLTGASRGLGVALAEALAQRGDTLVLTARSPWDLNVVAAGLVARGARVKVIPCDLAAPGALPALVDEAQRRVGPISLLVNNAGGAAFRSFLDATPEEIQGDLALNLAAPVELARLLLPGMLEQGRGHVVNIGTLAGISGFPHSEAYSAAKEGLVALTRTLRADFQARGVSASTVLVGWIRDMGAIPRAVAEAGITRPWWSRHVSVTGAEVVRATLKAVDRDLAEVVVLPGAGRLTRALMTAFPGLGPRINRVTGASAVAEAFARHQGRISAREVA